MTKIVGLKALIRGVIKSFGLNIIGTLLTNIAMASDLVVMVIEPIGLLDYLFEQVCFIWVLRSLTIAA
jgi:hypothetical protein